MEWKFFEIGTVFPSSVRKIKQITFKIRKFYKYILRSYLVINRYSI